MLSYTSFLIICLVVSAVVYFIRKVVADSARSVYRSREPLALVDRQDHLKSPASKPAPTGNPAAFGMGGEHSTPENFAKTYPAMPANSVDWRWEGSGVQLRELPTHPGHAKGNTGHCSLYDANSQQATAKPNPYADRLHREENRESAGRSYRLKRKAARASRDEDRDLHKPWGW